MIHAASVLSHRAGWALLACLLLCACGGDGGGSSAPATYTVTAQVSGLTGNGLVMQLNGGDNLAVSDNGMATFATTLAAGTKYTVAVGTQPSGQYCAVANGSSTVGSSNVTVNVSCNPTNYTLSVTLTGLAAATTVVLQLNSSGQIAFSQNTSETFSTKLATGEPYSVTVLSQPTPPPTQSCAVANASGTVGMANVSLTATCTTTYSVSASVSGLAGSGLTLLLNGGDPLAVTANGTATFSSTLAAGSNYAVTVQSQPMTPPQTCTVANGSGTVGNSNVASVTVTCPPLIYSATVKGEWTLMSLPSADEPPGFASPGARCCAATWTDISGNLWLFGGMANVFNSTTFLGDLWRYDPSTGVWTQIAPTAPPAITPAARSYASTFVDAAGNLWLFGGEGGTSGYNDLWRYTIATNTWTSVTGSTNTPGATGVYGVQGTPAPGNTPGARQSALSWVDAHGNFWLFGGADDSHPDYVPLNDLWEYSSSTGEWVWVDGSVAGTVASGPLGVYGTLKTPSSSNVPGARSGSVSWIDSAGNLWLFGGSGNDSTGSGQLNDLWKYTPAATFGALGTWTWMGGPDAVRSAGTYRTQGTPSAANVPGARYGAAGWVDMSSNFWLYGGVGCAPQMAQGCAATNFDLSDLWSYSPTAGTWIWVSGPDTSPGNNSAGSPGVPTASSTPGIRDSAAAWVDASGNFWLYGGQITDDPLNYLRDLWVFTP